MKTPFERLTDSAPELLVLLQTRAEEFHGKVVALVSAMKSGRKPFDSNSHLTKDILHEAIRLAGFLNQFVADGLQQPLSTTEVFVLVYAVLLHDVSFLTCRSGARTMRVDYFDQSRQFVTEHSKRLRLNSDEASAIGEICRAQGMPSLAYLSERVPGKSEYEGIRLDLLAALLRLARALRVTPDRLATIAKETGRTAKFDRERDISRDGRDVLEDVCRVEIRLGARWEIRIRAKPTDDMPDVLFYGLRNGIQRELELVSPLMRSNGVLIRRVNLALDRKDSGLSKAKRRNPFLLLAPFTSREAWLFAGRDREIQELVERVFGRRVVILIGESGVGKTSLVDAGLIPQLRDYRFGVIRFSFQKHPVDSLRRALLERGDNHAEPGGLVEIIDRYLKKRKYVKNLLIIGDHLEQMFTTRTGHTAKDRFVSEISRVVGSTQPVTFLFCIREDYLPDLYNLSLDMPELYDRQNTVRLHRLSKENAVDALMRASKYAFAKLPSPLAETVAQDLADEGGGMVYPPFLQIVGNRLYATVKRRQRRGKHLDEIPSSVYRRLGGVEEIVNRYFDGLLDQYSHQDKSMVGRILSTMVTDYYTKKRVRTDELHNAIPECENLEHLLSRLVQQRIVRRSLGEYELIHDFLARKAIRFIEQKRFLSGPVQGAIDFMEAHCSDEELTCEEIARHVDISQAHLGTLFRQQLGVTINHYLGYLRVVKAKTVLAQGRDRMSDIASRAGFKSPCSFSRKFREIEGMSPMEYRKTYFVSDTEKQTTKRRNKRKPTGS